MTILISLMLLVLLFIASAFFSGSETALFSLKKIHRKRIAEQHPRLFKHVDRLIRHPGRTLVTLLIGNLITNTLATALATLIILNIWGLAGLGLWMVIFTLCLIIFCEILPKTVAVSRNETFSAIIAWPLHVFGILVYPFERLMRMAANGILSLLTISEKKEHTDKLSEEELITLVTIGEEEGVLDRQERYMIHKLFELGERQVKEIMTPRVDAAALDVEDTHDEHLELIQKFHFSHFPVYEESLDHVLGVVPVQNFLLSRDKILKNHLKQPLFVPESKRIDDLLEEFRKTHNHFAICVDEFGGTAGIVTLEDVLEEIFGEFHDEYAKVESPIRPLGKTEYLVEAKIGMVDFNEYFGLELEAEEAATLGGFILEKLGEVPLRGKVLELPEMRVQIHQVVRHRIVSVIVRPKR